MKRYDLLPGRGFDAIRLGMDCGQVRAAAAALGLGPGPHRDTLDYFADNAVQVEYGDDGRAMFIGIASTDAFAVSLLGVDAFGTGARAVFDAIAAHEPNPPAYDRSGALFRAQVVTLWEADRQYDRSGERRVVWGQVGIGDAAYLAAIDGLDDEPD